jgi:hypothetical protein
MRDEVDEALAEAGIVDWQSGLQGFGKIESQNSTT